MAAGGHITLEISVRMHVCGSTTAAPLPCRLVLVCPTHHTRGTPARPGEDSYATTSLASTAIHAWQHGFFAEAPTCTRLPSHFVLIHVKTLTCVKLNATHKLLPHPLSCSRHTGLSRTFDVSFNSVMTLFCWLLP